MDVLVSRFYTKVYGDECKSNADVYRLVDWRAQTLIPIDFGIKSTYDYNIMIKINISYVKILQSSYKVLLNC